MLLKYHYPTLDDYHDPTIKNHNVVFLTGSLPSFAISLYDLKTAYTRCRPSYPCQCWAYYIASYRKKLILAVYGSDL